MTDPIQLTTTRKRATRDRGSVVVEAAIVLPLLFMLLFGVLEIGSALKSYSGAANAVRAGGRMGSVAGNDASADQLTMARVAREAAGIGEGEIDYVIIWKATGPGQSPPATCVDIANAASGPNASSVGVYDGGVGTAGACNIYMLPEAADGAFDMALGRATNPDPNFYFGCTGPSGPGHDHKLDCNWSPKNRKVQVSPRGTDPADALKPDFLGVYIKATHEYVTGILGSTLTITESGINLLEPDTFGVAD
jgi:hypothetical protein